MMEYVLIPESKMESLRSDRKFQQKLKELAEATLSFEENTVEIDCEDPINLLRVKEVIKAYGRGFDPPTALYLLSDDYELCIVDITEFAGKNKDRLGDLRGIVIGTEGKTRNLIEKYSEAKLAVQGKTVAILGKWSSVNVAREAVVMLLDGRKHGTVYKFLEESVAKVK
jgi:ribosomal RNA assembly protein